MAPTRNRSQAWSLGRILQGAGRVLLRWRFRLFQQHRHDRLVLEWVAGRPIVVLPGVLNPGLFRTGEFLAALLDDTRIPPGSAVLDMGTGSGIGAIAATCRASRVVAVDINPAAVRCARINALLNGVEQRLDVREGDLFSPVGDERFDVVLFNPPFFRGVPRTDLERALWSTDVAERFAAELPAHLRPGGCALVVLSTEGDERGFLDAFRAAGLTIEAAARRTWPTETYTVYRLENPARQAP